MSRNNDYSGSDVRSSEASAFDSKHSPALTAAIELLQAIEPGGSMTSTWDDATCSLAANLHQAAAIVETSQEEIRRADLALLMHDRKAQLFSTLLTDRVPRLEHGEDIVRQALAVLRQTGIPRSMPRWDQVQLKALQLFGAHTPTWAGAGIRRRIRQESAAFLAPGEMQPLAEIILRMRAEGLGVNVNPLGEEVLGRAEAERHMQQYLSLLHNPVVDTISVKLSSICSKVSVLAWDASLSRACEALERLYRAAMSDGAGQHKLVMLDMEAYRDLELAQTAFRKVLSQTEFQHLRAGIVLQAYLPDSHGVQQQLIDWALERRRRGGAAIQVRLVKGANLAVEQVESSEMGWPIPIYQSKAHVDASFKVMLERAMVPEVLDAMRLGIASHNLFDIAHSLLSHRKFGSPRGVHFEVLTGMGNALARVLLALQQEVLVYTPSVERHHRHAAVAYLVRRLDENTAPENFLHHSFGMSVGDSDWTTERVRFLRSRELQLTLDTSAKRRPVRLGPVVERGPPNDEFANEADTDFSLVEHRRWVNSHLSRLKKAPIQRVPLYIAGNQVERKDLVGKDPSNPADRPYQITLATKTEVQEALQCAHEEGEVWKNLTPQERARSIRRVAQLLRERRGQLIAGLVMDGGKGVVDADAEVSEAIDFAEYYAECYLSLVNSADVNVAPRGVTVVVPPWNFPLAIPLGGAFAALVAGNSVIVKPALETPYIAARAIEICHEAGIPCDVLQMVVATDDIATALITDKRVRTVVLTGSTQTARLFRRLRPDLYLLAETGGKNTSIVTRFADRDRAVHDVVQSAFGHAGQKCSAASILIVTSDMVNNVSFQRQLVDAASSLMVGSAWDPDSDVTPLIHVPEEPLSRGLTSLEKGETWWLQPKACPDNPRLWSPGIRFGVQPQSFAHRTEFFGPMLSVMVADDLSQAISWANDTEYGLTASLHSLNEAEQEQFVGSMQAGNLYVNRATTGAIVRRQPFGGRKASSFGPGAKAGGPNYIQQFVDCRNVGAVALSAESKGLLLPAAAALVQAASKEQAQWLAPLAHHYEVVARAHFRQSHDPSKIRGQANDFQYQPHSNICIVPFSGASIEDFLSVLLAAITSQSKFQIAWDSQAPAGARVLVQAIGSHVGLSEVSEISWTQQVLLKRQGRLRVLGPNPECAQSLVADNDWFLDDSPVLHNARRELAKYYLEQCVSVNYHRYGHLGVRELANANAKL